MATSASQSAASDTRTVFRKTLHSAKKTIESYLQKFLEKQVKRRLSSYIWSNDDIEDLEDDIVVFWKRISSSEYPVFTIGSGSNEDFADFFGALLAIPESKIKNKVLPELTHDKWLEWDFPLGTLRLVDLRDSALSCETEAKNSELVVKNSSLPEDFRSVDVEFHFVGTEEESLHFSNLEVQGLGEVKYINRGNQRLPRRVVVVVNSKLSKEIIDATIEVAERRGWGVIAFPQTTENQMHLAELVALYLPKSKQAGFARVSKSPGLRHSEARELVRFAVLLASTASTFGIPTAVVPIVTAIHIFTVLRIGWLNGRDLDAKSVGDMLKIVNKVRSVQYGMRAFVGSTASLIPFMGQLVSSYLLAGITEQLGSETIDFYLENQ